ncbi:MAG: hypothetical protein GY827_10410 [Cytophagales bacterium]|nr:hypothetical protein [Cytophagales bacterium]
MKKVALGLLLIFGFLSFAKKGYDYRKLNKKRFACSADYKQHEELVLKCADFILSTPISQDEHRECATKFLMKWANGTPDYRFEIDKTFVDLTKGKNSAELAPLYFACLIKTVLTHDNISKEEMKEKALNTYLDYCGNRKNRVKKNKTVKQLLKQRKE